jgi:uridine monophosphate synthetase
MESFFSFLERRVDDCSSLLCVGLDPHVSDLPAPTAAAALDFCLNLVKQTAPYAAAFKPNAAFFEALGPEGWRVLKQVIDAIHEQSVRLGSMIPVVLDAKRGDIASTAEAYAQSAFKTLGAHCITLSPYLGYDSIEPFLEDQERGVFILCKTSNPGSADLQDVPVLPAGFEAPLPFYLYVASLARKWNSRKNVGIVVGATHLQILSELREAAPELWILAPGVGTQGGELESTLKAGLRKDGKGLLVPISRAISRAPNPAQAAAQIRDQMLSIRMEYQLAEKGKPNGTN